MCVPPGGLGGSPGRPMGGLVGLCGGELGGARGKVHRALHSRESLIVLQSRAGPEAVRWRTQTDKKHALSRRAHAI